ncbi:MAG: nucleoside 2-deoxyribosyltransferase [Verrucomicrobiales bacterium]|nr:nucleoside 2-deoxyribosyltransferase [Verrucomicrobiales bacterium]
MQTKLKVYVAGPYSRKTELEQYAEQLRDAGYVITASWLYRPEADDGGFGDEQKTLAAAEDLADIKRADVMLSFTEPPGTVNRRGGRHVELGLALAWGKAVICIGEREHVFHYLPQVVWHGSVDAAIAALDALDEKI